MQLLRHRSLSAFAPILTQKRFVWLCFGDQHGRLAVGCLAPESPSCQRSVIAANAVLR